MEIKQFTLSLFGINAYIVWDLMTREAALIDPGISTGQERARVQDFIENNGLKVTHIINTHMHIDHIVGNEWAKKVFEVPVSAHKADEALGERSAEQAAMFGLPFSLPAMRIDEYIEDGDIIHIGYGELKAIHVPGHSPGSIVLYDKADHFIIAGDVLFSGSIGRTDLPGGSMNQLISGIKNRLMTLPDNTVVYPGHGPSTTIGAERSSNPFLVG